MRTMLRGLSACTLAGLAAPALADDSSSNQYTLEIERQPIVAALTEFSRQTGLQVGYLPRSEREESTIVAALNGQYTAESGLQELLAPSGLSFERVNEKTLAVMAPRSRFERIALAGDAKKSDIWRKFRLAEAEMPSGVASKEAAERSSAYRKASDPLEEVIVTAQKRAERLQDVPLAIAVLGGAQLDKFTGLGVMQALDGIPGVNATTSELGDGSYLSAGGSMVMIRGVGPATPVFGGSSPVAVYVDSIPFGLVNAAIAPDSNAYDLERVEVLKGPQGTLYGANALNGVMRILTHEPEMESFDFKTRLSASSTKKGAEQYRGDAAINVPIVPGKWAARAVVGFTEGGGWIDGPVEQDINDASLKNFRLKVKGQPTERLSLGASAWISRQDYGAPNTGDMRDFNRGTDNAHAKVDYDAVGLNASYEFPGFKITSETSYIDYLSHTDADYSGIAPFLTPEWPTYLDARVLAQEFNVASAADGPWRWTAGLFYRDAEDRLRQQYLSSDLAIYSPPPPSDYEYGSKSYAVYGELTRSFADGRWELTGGLRYFEDDAQIHENIPSDGNPATPLIKSKAKFDNVSPRLILSWKPIRETMFYASYSEGFRSGANQNPITIFGVVNGLGIDIPPAEPDTLRNYEIGAKGSWLDGRVSYEAAVYYIDWQDIQYFTWLSNAEETLSYPVIANGNTADGVGYEFALTFEPIDRLSFGVAYLHSDLKLRAPIFASTGQLLVPGGARPNFATEYKVNGWASYGTPIGNSGLQFQMSVSGSYTPSLVAYKLLPGFVQVLEGEPQRSVRAELGIDSPSHWSAKLYAENLTDDRNLPMQISPGNPNHVFTARRQPRTVGAQLEYRF